MKKFRFRLEKLLDIRRVKEREVQNELARILSIQNRERERQDELRRTMEAQSAKFTSEMRSGRGSADAAMIYERFFDRTLRAIEGLEKKIQGMEPEIQKIRERLVTASKEKKVVEKLKSRRRAEFEYQVSRESAKENDDMNQKIFERSRIEER